MRVVSKPPPTGTVWGFEIEFFDAGVLADVFSLL